MTRSNSEKSHGRWRARRGIMFLWVEPHLGRTMMEIGGLKVVVQAELSPEDRRLLESANERLGRLVNLAEQENEELDAIEASLKTLGDEITTVVSEIEADGANEVTDTQLSRLKAIGAALTSDVATLNATAASSTSAPVSTGSGDAGTGTGTSTTPASTSTPTTPVDTSGTAPSTTAAPTNPTAIDTTEG